MDLSDPEDPQEHQVPLALKVSRECEENQVTQDPLVLLVLQDHAECPESLEKMVRMERMVLLVHQAQLDPLVPVVCPACLVFLV